MKTADGAKQSYENTDQEWIISNELLQKHLRKVQRHGEKDENGNCH